ncbi:1-deoxy-D-xylulose-5-phosphate synthase [Desulfosudis oleivorans]|uniref:1-deoxy-D-xylulose-5-phosphate synthase n=1 Tax=Desulfosudis oleivorans (strain DSM 6200 / JCM 39069 / Hxd3) TaxID=96561 RepID=A9A0G6_DESOH|nr:1-deoxy-D-xylulose-5-phosphate synthase [Desulfosudis oleivorans]ABW67466.1 deoxyxylulose-5-phosphate synthase [Desulfosudis oleivorans Hxd3]
MGLLETIDSPADLKKLPVSDLPALAEEIRELIVRVVSETGGHLASSLGAVELAIAIHYVFDVPNDRVIWDVGHQSYAHKILTGRREQFSTLRQHGGLSGFTKRSESPFDSFSTGHSGTSISASLGFLCAKHQRNDPSKVVAVIGDGSMTAGLAYEGLNQAGDRHKDKNLIVILNENDMSISQNVGALSSFLSRTLSATYLQDWRKELGELLRSLPGIGDDVYQFAKRSEESFKTFVTPGMLFEAFNLEYFGPINGHKIKQLVNILQNIREIREPVLLHVTTTKGKGYEPAERDPAYFHGVGAFEITTGSKRPDAAPCPSTYTQVFGRTMVELAEKDPAIVAVTAAMPEGTGLAEFAQRFPDRFYDVGIAEQHGVTFAAGMAADGLRPVVAIYSTFLQRSYDQIIHDVCLESLPVTFAIDRAGIVGEDGPTHHGLFDLSYLRSMPNMTIMAPADENELRRMLVTAISHNGPAAVRYPRGKGTGAALADPLLPVSIGKAKILTKGGDILILAIGRTVCEAMAARQQLETEGISATVVNCRFVKPLDEELICDLARAIPRILTVEDSMLAGGFSSAVLECLNDHRVTGVTVKRLGIGDTFVEHGSQEILRAKYAIDARAIVVAAKELMA